MFLAFIAIQALFGRLGDGVVQPSASVLCSLFMQLIKWQIQKEQLTRVVPAEGEN